jgi:hypothetical protein
VAAAVAAAEVAAEVAAALAQLAEGGEVVAALAPQLVQRARYPLVANGSAHDADAATSAAELSEVAAEVAAALAQLAEVAAALSPHLGQLRG